MTSAYVLRVLMTMLMINLGGLGHNDRYNVRIIFTYGRTLRQGRPVRPFFLALIRLFDRFHWNYIVFKFIHDTCLFYDF